MKLSFDDTLIIPKFSFVRSRKDVDLSQDFLGIKVKSPLISSNMDTITESTMATSMREHGGIGALHRFMSIEKNVEEFKKSPRETIVSIGIGEEELNRAKALKEAGANWFLIDVANGAAIHVVEQYNKLRALVGYESKIIVGNFATYASLLEFDMRCISPGPDAYKIGIGTGSMCTTRIVTGCGLPSISSLVDCSKINKPLIMDGGIRNSGDIAKALAAGATMVMVGSLLAGTMEAAAEMIYQEYDDGKAQPVKKYRGSASFGSYIDQQKYSDHRAPEGEETLVPYKGQVKEIVQKLNAGLCSALTYTNSSTIIEFVKNAELVEISSNSHIESGPHGK